ncbi:MAG: sigma-70 family RNA polymerase sigma factor [Bacillaceae bacterium]|nr:sigma-70 family RNA polymerase sigma factor [Bacillaceae bacterium]
MSNFHDEIHHLLEQIKQGAPAAFEQFYDRYIPLVYHIALKMVQDRMEAEDICQEVFLEALRKLDRFDPARGSMESWLAVMTRSRCVDHLRKKQRQSAAVLEDSVTGEHPAENETEVQVVQNLEIEAVRRALDQIPAAQREAVLGMYFRSRTQRELAEEMNRPLGTVKSLIRYGITNIKKQLNQFGWMEPSGGAKKHE